MSVSIDTASEALPVLGADPVERADAVRNRNKILCAAIELFEQRGADHVSMDDVAEAAGVGKGTLYRRFGDRAGLARAILHETEVAFQENLIRGEPPLGPGADPVQRLIAFGEAVVDRLELHGDLMLAAETGQAGARFQGLVYATYRAHVRSLLAEINPQIDVDYVPDVLLAALSAEMVNYWLGSAELPAERIKDGYVRLVRIIVAGCPSGA
ncbi:MAG: TetR/AcrR family transcriptional regulator [Solirubrobacterales bacterium]